MNAVCPSCGLEGGGGELLVDGLCPRCVARSVQSGLLSLLGEEVVPVEKEAVALELEGYEVHELIGGGGMGEVYRGVRLEDGLTVAIKVVAGRFTRDPEVTVRFENEVSAMAQLDHVNVVRVLDQGLAGDGRHYLVSEFVDGCDLRRLLRAQRLEMGRAFEIFDKVCAGISHAHERDIVHRDIKPANLLIGTEGVVKVADFGLAKTLVDDTHWYGFTQTRDTFGTPYYIAPEVTRQAGKADVRSDVYALGVLLYELLCGAVPMGKYTLLSERTGLGRGIDGIMALALADDPERRTGSVKVLAEGVRKIARGYEKRQRRGHYASLLLAVLVVLGLGGALGGWLVLRGQGAAVRPSFPAAGGAEKGRPWVNGLGMQFVPVPGRELLVGVYETRVRDYAAFSKAENAVMPAWRSGLVNPRAQMKELQRGRAEGRELEGRATTWDAPGFPQTLDHPVTGVDLIEARLFCTWLTWTERLEGRLSEMQAYRLPTEAEWTEIASHDETVWLREDANALANFAGIEAVDMPGWPEGAPYFPRRDAFPRTSPVGSFKGNALGLYDLFGNVAEWVDTPAPDSVGVGNVLLYGLRGGSWGTGTARQARPDFHIGARPGRAQANYGFRVLLDLALKS